MILVETLRHPFDLEALRADLAAVEKLIPEQPDLAVEARAIREAIAEIEARARGAERPADGPEGSGRS